ncbi:hypothetical protein B6N60_00738 [Richelia sinica FACHB-800]|uniref:Uncharacterized protein n=1 Tax=Richelia sinica FACHB-800 TaxID=1357546 RepID=A0A975T5Y8_9NOST|nr:hypothetical protein B6N60_00738 [Richelia sinica FACHB-800]
MCIFTQENTNAFIDDATLLLHYLGIVKTSCDSRAIIQQYRNFLFSPVD